jgi:hypothetical protein
MISESSHEPGWRLILRRLTLLCCHLQNDERASTYLSEEESSAQTVQDCLQNRECFLCTRRVWNDKRDIHRTAAAEILPVNGGEGHLWIICLSLSLTWNELDAWGL